MTSATAAFTSGDTGKQVVVWDAGPANAPLFSTMTYVNATTVTLADAATMAVTVMAVSIGTRDTRIHLIGGTWDANGNLGVSTILGHLLRFQHIDGIKVHGLHITGLTAAFGLTLTDVTDFDIDGIEIDCRKGQVQFDGPLWRGSINNITGWQADDFVALVCNEWPGYAACAGPISDVTITNLKPRSGVNFSADCAVLKLLPGSPYWMRDVHFENIMGTSQGVPVKLGDDGAWAGTNNSLMKGIVGKNISAKITNAPAGVSYPLVSIGVGLTGDIRDIRLDGLRWEGAGASAGARANVVSLYNTGSYGGVVQSLEIDNLTIDGAGPYVNGVYVGRVVVNNLSINRVRVPVQSTAFHLVELQDSNSVVTNIVLNDIVAVLYSTAYLVYTNQSTVSRLSIDNSDLLVGGSSLFCAAAQTSPKTLVRVSNTRSMTYSFVSTSSPVDLHLSNCEHAGGGSIVDLPYVGATGSTIRGGGSVGNPGNKAGLTRATGVAVSCKSPLFACDISLLTPNNGDVAYNTNAALACGAGLVVCNGTNWKNLYTGLVY